MLLPFSLYRFLSPFTSFLYPYSSALPWCNDVEESSTIIVM
jgi:hypothetical protein